MIYLSDDDSRSVGFCQCDALGPPRHIVFALLAVPHHFRPAPLVAPPSLPDESSRCARAAYMCAWHARAREAWIQARAIVHTHRLSSKVVEASPVLGVVSVFVGWNATMYSTTYYTHHVYTSILRCLSEYSALVPFLFI